jgi:hypothetical protein
MSPSHTGAVLLKCLGPLNALKTLPEALTKLARECMPLAESVTAHAAVEAQEIYAYLFSREPGAITAAVLESVAGGARALPNFNSLQVGAVRLQPVFDTPGASRGEAAPFHYVVETDVIAEHEADLNAWYDTEHMPGLAACPGSVRARRFRNPDGSPRHHSCYDLTLAETLGSEPWLAVRHTAWSDRVRPHFRNTKRTMFRRLFEAAL